jgi:UDP-glucuronate 4-epimerase
VLGLDNFNDYYPVALKRARQAFAASNGVYIVDGDINDAPLLAHLFDVCDFTHVLHLAAQVGWQADRQLCFRPASFQSRTSFCP